MAHIDLAKAEASAIAGELGRFLAAIGGAVALVLLAALLAVIGTSLFIGEWLLGSLGWGVLHGVELFVAIAIALVLAALGVSAGRLVGAFVVGLLVGVLVAVVFALSLPNQAYTAIGDASGINIEAGVRPLVVGMAIWAGVGLLLGIGLAIRASGAGARFGSIVGGILLGGLFGAFTAIEFDPRAGVGVGIAAGYATWIVLMLIDISRTGVDVEALQARFTPTQTIETSKETLEWLQKRMPPGTGS
jgi:hypothetical protein